MLPGNPALWTAAAVASLAFPLVAFTLEALGGPSAHQPLAGLPARAGARTPPAGWRRVLLQLTFLASQAYEMVHAIAVTLVRLAITRRRLLEWETAAASAARGARLENGTGPRSFLLAMVASPAIALGGLVLAAGLRPGALAAAAPVLVLWAAAPLLAYRLSQPIASKEIALGDDDRAFLLGVARATWS